jgi:hypothetical protein
MRLQKEDLLQFVELGQWDQTLYTIPDRPEANYTAVILGRFYSLTSRKSGAVTLRVSARKNGEEQIFRLVAAFNQQ